MRVETQNINPPMNDVFTAEPMQNFVEVQGASCCQGYHSIFSEGFNIIFKMQNLTEKFNHTFPQ